MDQIKEKFLIDQNTIFLNHGSYGACPRPVFQEYQRWQRLLEEQPVHFFTDTVYHAWYTVYVISYVVRVIESVVCGR